MAPDLFRVPRNGIPAQVTGVLVGVNGDLPSLAVPGAKPFAPFPWALSWPGRCVIRSRGLREAGQAACGRRSTRSRVNLLTSRYPLAADDRAPVRISFLGRGAILMPGYVNVDGWAGCEPDEVCAVLDVSEGNQRVMLHRARSRVRASARTG